jgi:hypothetical protein
LLVSSGRPRFDASTLGLLVPKDWRRRHSRDVF